MLLSYGSSPPDEKFITLYNIDLMGSPLTCTLLAVALSASSIYHASAWTPGVGQESLTSGFSVDRQSRTDVVSFWHAVYKQSEGFEARMNWTGDLSVGAGTTSAEFKGDVQRRINYFRAMAGLSADMKVNKGSAVILNNDTPSAARPSASTTKGDAAQAAAFMLTWNTLKYRANPTHTPPSDWVVDGAVARNGAYYSNLASGFYGPDAIDRYIRENDQGGVAGNEDVGHRRLILYSRRSEFATGDVPADLSDPNTYAASNALYVTEDVSVAPSYQFVAWPSDGFFPEPLATKYWSLSYPGADFSAATVTMSHVTAGTVSVSIVSNDAHYGDNTLVWEPVASQLPSAEEEDQTYQVTVSNIVIDSKPLSYTYSVTVINPNRLLEYPALNGNVTPDETGDVYDFNTISQAEAYRLQVLKEAEGVWFEGAEDATSVKVIDGTADTYDLRVRTASRSGSLGFHIGLTLENLRLQYVELDREIVPSNDSYLVFYHRKRTMGSDTRAKAEISIDHGVTWSEVWGLQGDGKYASVFTRESVSLSAYAGKTVRIRFAVERPVDATANIGPADKGDGYGIHIDDVQVTGEDAELINLAETDYPTSAPQVTLDAETANESGGVLDGTTSYWVRLQTRIGTHWFTGPALVVSPVGDGVGGEDESVVVDLPDDLPGALEMVPTVVSSASAGKYGGFLTLAEGGGVSGYFKSINISTKGTFSAKMYMGSVSYAIKGSFDENGHYSGEVTPKKGASMAVDFQLMRGPSGGCQVVGTVTVEGEVSEILAVKAGATSRQSGAYTLLVLGDGEEGYGYGMMAVTSTGSAKVKGLLGDGSKWTAKCYVSSDGVMPLYAVLYKKQGHLGCMVRFRDVAGVSDCDGGTLWKRSNVFVRSCHLVGSRFQSSRTPLLDELSLSGGANVVAQIGAGSGYDPMSLDLEWTSANKILYAGPEKVKISVKTASGQVKGKIPSDGLKWVLDGVVFQKQNLVGGMMYVKGGTPRSMMIVPKK
jgi:hypothetical protein